MEHIGEQQIDAESAREVFRRFLAGGDADNAMPPDLSLATRARMDVFADAMRDAVAGARVGDENGIEAAFAQARQVSSRLDMAEVHQIKEKYGRVRLYVEFDRDDDLPPELRTAEPRCPSRPELAAILGVTDGGRDNPIGEAWSEAYEAVFVPAHEAWSARAAAIRESADGRLAAEDQSRRVARFDALVDAYEQESESTCDRCGSPGGLSRSTTRVPWYATRCDACRPDGWIRVSE